MSSFKNKVSNIYFNIIDIENTLDKKTKSLTRRHAGTENSDTIGELIEDVKLSIEELLHEELEESVKDYPSPFNSLAWAIVETLNGKYKLKTLAAADKAGDSIELELYGTKEEAQKQFKQHLKELKKGGYFE